MGIGSQFKRAVLASTLALAVSAPCARAAEPGLNVGGNFFSSAPTFQAIADSGTHYVRFFLFWQSIEPDRGRYDEATLRAYDAAISVLQPGTKVLLVVVGAPLWANGSSDIHVPPRNAADYANFVSQLASHFRGRVAAYEIWNEEDASIWWTGDVNAYTALLRAAYPAVKAADPAATIVMGGLTGNDADYLAQVYAAGGGGSFDVVSDHTDTACNLVSPAEYLTDPDGSINRFSFLGYRHVHQVMVDHGDGAKPIWLSEMGWNTSRQICDSGLFKGEKAGGVSEATQARYLQQAYHCLAEDPYVQVGFWFQLQDATSEDTPQGRFGLLRSDFTRRPAFSDYSEFARSGDRITGPCGDFSLPSITIASPLAGSSYRGPLKIRVSASSSKGMSEIQLRYDSGARIRNYLAPRGSTRPHTLTGEITWQHGKHLSVGKHSIIVTAIDAKGTKSTQSVIVNHLGGSQLTYRRVRHHRGVGHTRHRHATHRRARR